MTKLKSKSTILLLLLLCATLLLNSCYAIANLREMPDGSLWHKATDSTYIPCSVSLRAYKLSTVFGKNEKGRFYSVKYEEKDRFIAEEDEIGGTVYRHMDVPEITIENFAAVAAHIYMIGNVRIQLGELLASPDILGDTSKIVNYQDGTEKVNAVVDAVSNGERLQYPVNIDEDRVYEIGLLSADFPGLVYTVYFMVDMQGNAFLNDRATKVVVKCPDIVKKFMLKDSSTETDTSATESEADEVSK